MLNEFFNGSTSTTPGRSLRFNSADSEYLNFQPSSAGNRKTWTWSGWVKRSQIGGQKHGLFGGSGLNSMIRFNNDDGGDNLRVLDAATGGYDVITDRKFRDTSAWYHFVVAIDTTQSTAANRVKIYVNGVQETSFWSSSYPTQNADLTFNNNISHTIGYAPGSTYHNGYLAEVNFIDGQALDPTSFGAFDSSGVWQAKEFAGSYTLSATGIIYSNALTASTLKTATAGFNGLTTGRAEGTGGLTFTPVGGIAYTNSVEIYDTNNVTRSQVNGGTFVQHNPYNWVTLASGSGTLNTLFSVRSDNSGWDAGFMAIRVDGVILTDGTPASGANSFHLDFADNSSDAALGTDNSGNGNDFTVYNLSHLAPPNRTAHQNFDAITYTGTGSDQAIALNFQPDFVWIKTRSVNENNFIVDSVRGVTKQLYANATASDSINANRFKSFDSDGFTVGTTDDTNESGVSFVAWAWNAGANSNKTYTVKVVSDSGNKYRFDDFGTSAVTLDLAEGSTYIFDQSDSSNAGHPIRFGTSSNGTNYTTGVTHTGTPGSAGAKTTIVVASAVDYSSYMSESSTSGNLFDGSLTTFYGPSGNTCTFIPNTPITVSTSLEIWFKSASASRNFEVNDSGTTISTGTSASGKWVDLNFTGSLTKISGTNGWNVAAIRIDGAILQNIASTPTLYYSCLNHSGMGGQINTNSTAGASNFDGSIQSIVKANADYGFSVVSYTGNQTSGATVGHGLSTAPGWIVIKSRDSSLDWIVYHSSVGNTGALRLNASNTTDVNAKWFNDAGPSSSTFTLGNTTGTNKTGDNMIAYVWSEVAGFSKFGSYSGGTNPKTITTGFKPRYLLIKASSHSAHWQIIDSARGGTQKLASDLAVAENDSSTLGGTSINTVEFLDDGFKLTTANTGTNQSGYTYIYAAFAGTVLNQPDADSFVDFPVNGTQTDTGLGGEISGNYCTLNPLHSTPVIAASTAAVLSNGNLDVTSSSDNREAVGTFGVSSGKWYYEVTQQDSGNFTNGVGWYKAGTSEESLYRDGGTFFFNGTSASYGASWQSSGDVIGIALDIDNSTISFYKNGVSQGDAKTDLSAGTYIPLVYVRKVSDLSVNFGQRPFAYPISGYKCLNTASLPTPTIADGSLYFDTKLYTGTGGTQSNVGQDVTGLSFSPDLVWIKSRSHTARHGLFDTVRGVQRYIQSNVTAKEVLDTNALEAFLSDGFRLGNDGPTNENNESFVSWNWDAGTSTVTNNDGTVESQVRAQPSAGFSVVSYTGPNTFNASVGHGLNATPKLILIKNRDSVADWRVYTTALDGSLDRFVLNSSGGKNDSTQDLPTNLTFSITNGVSDGDPDDYVAYCFAPVAGYSAIGSYIGNGNANGPFVYTGFKVAWLLIKKSGSSTNWQITDSARSPYNVAKDILRADADYVENTQGKWSVDFLSNGFKQRTNGNGRNSNGSTYLYLAFASNPFQANGGLAR